MEVAKLSDPPLLFAKVHPNWRTIYCGVISWRSTRAFPLKAIKKPVANKRGQRCERVTLPLLHCAALVPRCELPVYRQQFLNQS
jgi:hypothetical protein